MEEARLSFLVASLAYSEKKLTLCSGKYNILKFCLKNFESGFLFTLAFFMTVRKSSVSLSDVHFKFRGRGSGGYILQEHCDVIGKYRKVST